MTSSSTNLRDLLLRYLLGEVEPFEREEIDTALIADPEFADAIEDARNDLLDEYAAGRLSPQETARVRQAIAENAAFARAADMAAALRLARQQPPRGARSHTERRTRVLRAGWAIAATGIIAVASLIGARLLLVRTPASSSQAQLHSGATPAATAPLSSFPASASAPPASHVPAHRASNARPDVLVATFLMPETSRSTEPASLVLQASAATLRVEWPVPADNESNQQPLTLAVYQDAIQVAVASEQLPRHNIAGTAVARFTLPADRMQPGTYIFRIAAPAHPGQAPLVESTVQVSRR